jgi:5-formyltetrahydrofolate cyclo-ligase
MGFLSLFSMLKEMPEPDVVLVPALAVDGLGNRIGYGKGYYDAFLSEVKSCKIVPLFAKQVVDGIPSEPHDVPVDILVTEEGVYPLK